MLRMILVLFCYGAGTVMGLRSAVLASCFFIWSDVFRPDAWARYHGILHPSTFMPVHIVTGTLLLSLVIKPWKRRWNGVATAILIFTGWLFVSATVSKIPQSMEKAIEVSKYMIPLAIISATLCTRWAQNMFMYTLAASVGVWMIHHGFIAVLTGETQIRMSIPDSQMSDRNDFMVAGTACLPMIAYMGWHYVGKFQQFIRPVMKVGLGCAIAALFMSLSRGAFLGFFALAVWYGMWTGRLMRRLPLVLAGVVIIAMLLPAEVWERISTIEMNKRQSESSAMLRMEHMMTAVDVTLDFPITGVGPGVFWIASQRYSQFSAEPHSLWLKCSAELGLTMLIFFVMLVGRSLWRLRQVSKLARAHGDKQTEGFATALSCALVGFLATGSFTSQFMSEYMWAIIALIGAFLATPYEGSFVDPTKEGETDEADAEEPKAVPVGGTA